MIEHRIERQEVDIEIDLICDKCSSQQSDVLPNALVWEGMVICAKCLPENITEDIQDYLYNKCDQEGCDTKVFKLRRFTTCFTCLDKIIRKKRKEKGND